MSMLTVFAYVSDSDQASRYLAQSFLLSPGSAFSLLGISGIPGLILGPKGEFISERRLTPNNATVKDTFAEYSTFRFV